MLNLPARQEMAWDSGILNYYHVEHRARLPVAMKPGDSLASSISLRQGEKVTYPYHPGTVRGPSTADPPIARMTTWTRARIGFTRAMPINPGLNNSRISTAGFALRHSMVGNRSTTRATTSTP